MKAPQHDDRDGTGAPGLAARIRALRRDLGLSQARFAARVGIDQSNVSRWENGAVPEEAHIRRLAGLARVSPGVFRYGTAEPPTGAGAAGAPAASAPAAAAATVPVVGYVGAGHEVHAIDDHALGGGLEEVEAPEGVGRAPVVAVRVRGESMLPLRDGWLLFYRRNQQGVPEACLNQLCIVKLADDGPVLVKELRRGARGDRFVLASWNGPPIENARVDWAAPVLSIRP